MHTYSHSFYNWIPYEPSYTPLKIKSDLYYMSKILLAEKLIMHTRTYGPDLLRVYDIHQEPIYSYPRRQYTTNIPKIYGKHHTFRPKTPIYNEVNAHASTNDSIQTNTGTLIDP